MLRPPPILKAFWHFHERDATYHAAGIAFYLLFSLTPFLLLTLSIAAVLSADSGAFVGMFESWFQANIPRHADALRDSLLQVFEHRGRIGIVGVIWLFLTARKLFNAMEIGLNAMLEIEKPKSGVLTTLASLAFIFLTAVLFLASVLVTALVDLAFGIQVSFLSSGVGSILSILLKALFSGAVSVGLLYGIYRLAPSRGLGSRDAFMASACATLMWLVARHAFVWFGASQLARYEWLYGSLASFLMLLLWAYVFAIALLMGACVVHRK
ncbi:MAG: YihY/virulence factor BrkB family protein [Candidatus Brocadiae bacterium]|nr:YihY/virulence factor BrkB family protein [Candidatus Brocadiia bacterium]